LAFTAIVCCVHANEYSTPPAAILKRYASAGIPLQIPARLPD
jgi:hypothetical protein